MKKTLYILLTISLFFGYSSCSSDDNKELTQEEITQKTEELNNIYKERAELDDEMMKLIEDGISLNLPQDEYQEYLKKYVVPIQEKIKELGVRMIELEKELGIRSTL